MTAETAAAALADFAAGAGIEGLAFDAAGWAAVQLDDVVVNLELRAGGGLLALSAWLGEVPEPRRAAVALAIADANYLLIGTGGATLGLSRGAGDLVLTVQVETAALTAARLAQLLERFAIAAAAQRAGLLAETPPEEPAPDEAPAPALQIIRG